MNHYEDLASRNLFQELLDLRDLQRSRAKGALQIIEGNRVPIELSPWGRIQWYLHPTITSTANRALMFWVMHLSPGSRTGLMQCQGGHIYQVWRGSRGWTQLDGERYNWGSGCVVNLPLRPGGIQFQHVNDGSDEVVMLGSCLNFVDALTVDAGSEFEVLEPCPEWIART